MLQHMDTKERKEHKNGSDVQIFVFLVFFRGNHSGCTTGAIACTRKPEKQVQGYGKQGRAFDKLGLRNRWLSLSKPALDG